MSTTNVGARSAESEVFDFGTVETSSINNFLAPGNYWLQVQSCEFVEPTGLNSTGQKKSPYLEVIFGCKDGIVRERFFVTVKAMQKLQDLYTGIMNKKNDKSFDSPAAVGLFFTKFLTDPRIKQKELAMIVGGELSADGKVFGKLGWPKFILEAEVARASGFTHGAFEVNSTAYNNVVTKAKVYKNESTGTNSIVLGGGDSDIDSLPF